MDRRDRDFLVPALTGVGVAAAFLIEWWVLPYGAIFAPLGAPIVAVPVGTLRITRGRIEWRGIRPTVVCCVAALSTWLSFATAGVLPAVFRASFTLPLSAIDMPGFLLLPALEGMVSAWFAALLQPWVDRARPVAPRTRSRWNPQAWGVLGKVGGTLALLSAAGLVLIATISRKLYWPGPTYGGIYLSAIALGLAASFGICLLIVEAVRNPIRHK